MWDLGVLGGMSQMKCWTSKLGQGRMLDWGSISSSVGGAFALLLFLQSSRINHLLPFDLNDCIHRFFRFIFRRLDNYIYFRIEEYDGFFTNELYSAAQLHLSSIAAASARTARLTIPKNASTPTCTVADSEQIEDTYDGAKVTWRHKISQRKTNPHNRWREVDLETRSLELRAHKRDREKIISGYIPYVRRDADEIRRKQRQRLLYTNMRGDEHERFSGKVWSCVPFKNPSTFETLALEPELKERILRDLVRFTKSRAFYDRVGRAWKRGYLLFGPPGTGKSSMIAAMANLLEYDIYDLELTQVKSNSQLRNLLVQTTNRSIIVIEDIDCSLDLTNERSSVKSSISTNHEENEPYEPPSASGEDKPRTKSKSSPITLSGMLNFVDGLWSSCGEERIFVFTTNHVDNIDKALLRPGRMDMHIEFSYCGFEAFKILARNYLGLEEEHPLFENVRVVMEEEGNQMTPAEVSEVLTRER